MPPAHENAEGTLSVTTVTDSSGSGGLLKNPGMGLIENFGESQQVISTKTFRLLPVVAVLVETAHGDVVPGSDRGVVLPDRGFNAADSDFMDGGLFGLSLFGGHERLP
jgi:hypothetical protein